MKVINLSSWAGRSFDLAHGDLVEMPEGMARERIKAGFAREPTDDETETLELKQFPDAVVVQSEATAAAPRKLLSLPKGKRR